MIRGILILLIISSTAVAQEVSPAEIDVIGKRVLSITNSVKSYQFLLVKREYVDGKDTGYQYIITKVQSKPLQVYLKFLKPARYEGREALYKNGELIVRRGGRGALKELVVRIDPEGPMAMDGNKYPITRIDPSVSCARLIQQINDELKFPETRVYKKTGASIDKHPGIHYKLIHTTEQAGMRCMTAEMLISTKLNIPIYFKVVGWDRKVLEEYYFRDMMLDVKFTPNEFDEGNKEYGFKNER